MNERRLEQRNAGAHAAWADHRQGWLQTEATAYDLMRAGRAQAGGPAAYWRGYLAALLRIGYRRG